MADAALLVLYIALQIFFYLMVIRLIMSWVFQLSSYRATGGVAALLEVVYSVTDPPLKLLGRLVPPLPVGHFRLDVAFIALILGVQMLAAVVAGAR